MNMHLLFQDSMCWFAVITMFGAVSGPSTVNLQHSLTHQAFNATKSNNNKNMVLIKGGTFQMGDNHAEACEFPAHTVTVKTFFLDRYDVTIAEFEQFISATGYKTEAEKRGWALVYDEGIDDFLQVTGANWRHPDGPQSKPYPQEPVCQVSWNDAIAYASWMKKRLPTEAEWEYAARSGRQKKYTWGDDLNFNGKPSANILGNSDGYVGRSPVGKFPPNGFGLYDMTGNVWQWCADVFAPEYYKHSPSENPKGPEKGFQRVLRGGSFLCGGNHCSGYRVAARGYGDLRSAMNNRGFRCAEDVSSADK